MRLRVNKRFNNIKLIPGSKRYLFVDPSFTSTGLLITQEEEVLGYINIIPDSKYESVEIYRAEVRRWLFEALEHLEITNIVHEEMFSQERIAARKLYYMESIYYDLGEALPGKVIVESINQEWKQYLAFPEKIYGNTEEHKKQVRRHVDKIYGHYDLTSELTTRESKPIQDLYDVLGIKLGYFNKKMKRVDITSEKKVTKQLTSISLTGDIKDTSIDKLIRDRAVEFGYYKKKITGNHSINQVIGDAELETGKVLILDITDHMDSGLYASSHNIRYIGGPLYLVIALKQRYIKKVFEKKSTELEPKPHFFI